MSFNGFTQHDFNTFKIEGLENRMEAIRERIQPKFKMIGEDMTHYLTELLQTEMHLHVAQHARRTVNAPNDTWSAYCHNKRGYKKHPHFQIGLFDDRLFVWLAFIYELPYKKEIAELFLGHLDDLNETIPSDYVISMDHMKKDATPMNGIDLQATLERFKDVKKAELLIGKQFDTMDPLLQDGEQLVNEIKRIYQTLAPIYSLSFQLL
ncbi:MAG TPA: DUF1054 domain-containing protein [Virgibacillus sp.]|nr:DUF1054 domain-containing protein [Virgibacillus sp.]